jgi:hypothetical protein
VVTPGLGRVADLPEHGVGVGRVGLGEVRQRAQRLVALGAQLRLGVRQRSSPGRQRGQLLALLGRRRAAQRPTGGVLLGAELLELGRDRPPPLVELEHAVDGAGGVRAAARQGRAHAVGI